MASNRFEIADKSALLFTKLQKLSETLQTSLASDDFQTTEQFMFEAIQIMNSFYEGLSDPLLRDFEVSPDNYPDREEYYTTWNQVRRDLEIIFAEMENVESLSLGSFNYTMQKANRLIARMKNVTSLAGDYALYSKDSYKHSVFFGENFTTMTRIDRQSALLNAAECQIFPGEGTVTLPVVASSNNAILVQDAPVINSESNGETGNNFETGKQGHSDIAAIVDNNADTWFEYEKVTDVVSDKDYLVLDLILNLGTPQVVNNLRINPINFGTRTIVNILDISTSYDGINYLSVEDDIAETDDFKLAPSSSKYSGQGIYTFSPREAKYVRIILRQDESYPIVTSGNVIKYRLAIGIRDISVRGLQFQNSGELISTPLQLTDEIKKIQINALQIPESTSFAKVDWFLSFDNGQSWNQISPANISAGHYSITSSNESAVAVTRLPTIINVNTGDDNQIKTETPVTAFRVKMALSRDNEAFEQKKIEEYSKKVAINELIAAGNAGPHVLTLSKQPIEDSVKLVDPLFGCRGVPESPYVVGFQDGHDTQIQYHLPFRNFPVPVVKQFNLISGDPIYFTQHQSTNEWMTVLIGGEKWLQATQPLSAYSGDERVYSFDPVTGILSFGEEGTSGVPGANDRIEIIFAPERVFPSSAYDLHSFRLDFPTSSNKNSLSIVRYGEEYKVAVRLPKGETKVQLQHGNITDYSDIDSVLAGRTRVDFINGIDELTNSTHWSIDTDSGTIFLKSPLPANSDIMSMYTYREVEKLDNEDWTWMGDDAAKQTISIKEKAWKPNIWNGQVFFNQRDSVIDLPHMSIENGSMSVRYEGSADNGDPFVREVPFIDGNIELRPDLVKTLDRIDPSSNGLQVRQFKHKPAINNQFVFTNKRFFDHEVATVPTVPGEYRVDQVAGTYEFVTNQDDEDLGTVTYFYSNPHHREYGLYSIDYRIGKLFIQQGIMLDNLDVFADYRYSDYRASYRIAREIPESSYSVNTTNRTITITDEEVLARSDIPRQGFGPNRYMALYDTLVQIEGDAKTIVDFYSPMVKEYSVEVITKGKLF